MPKCSGKNNLAIIGADMKLNNSTASLLEVSFITLRPIDIPHFRPLKEICKSQFRHDLAQTNGVCDTVMSLVGYMAAADVPSALAKR